MPIVPVTVELGTYDPVVDEYDAEWRPVRYGVHAHHITALDNAGLAVLERTLTGLELVLEVEGDPEDLGLEQRPAKLVLPATVEGLEALIALLDNARDYVARELEE